MIEHQTQLPTTHKSLTDFSMPVSDIGPALNPHDLFSLGKAGHFCGPPCWTLGTTPWFRNSGSATSPTQERPPGFDGPHKIVSGSPLTKEPLRGTGRRSSGQNARPAAAMHDIMVLRCKKQNFGAGHFIWSCSPCWLQLG